MSVSRRLFALSLSLCLICFVFAATQPSSADDSQDKAKATESQKAKADKAKAKEAKAEEDKAKADQAKADKAKAEPTIALIGGTIHTLSSKGVVEGDLLIRGGKIVAVGKGIKIPKDAKRISVKGMNVTPGLIDVRSSLWLTTAAAREGSSNGGLSVLDGVDLFADDWKEVAKQGVTTVYVQPGSTGVLGGSGAVLRVAKPESMEQLTIAADAGAQSSLGVGGRTTTSRDRFAQYASLKKVLEAAKKYDDEWTKYEEYETKKAEKAKAEEKKKEKPKTDAKAKPDSKAKKPDDKKPGDKSDESSKDAKKDTPKKEAPRKEAPKSGEAKEGESKKGDTEKKDDEKSAKPPTKPKRDPAKDFLRKVIQGKTPLRLEAHRQDDVANALKLAKELKIRIILEGVSKPGDSLQSLLDSRVPLVLGPFAVLGSTPTYREGRGDDWATPLARKDSRWAIGTFSSGPRASRLLRSHAALAVAAGVKPELALRAITKDAANILGVGNETGTIGEGKRADLAVFAGHPLDPSALTVLTMSGGEITHQAKAASQASVDAKSKSLPKTLPENYAVRSTRVLRDGKLAPATIVVRKGKIVAIRGNNADVKNTPIFDVGSAVITPGLVSAYSELGQAGLIEDTADSITPDLRAADAFDPTLSAWQDFSEAGFQHIGLSPGTGNVISGHAAVVETSGDRATIAAPTAALKIVLTSTSRLTSRYPASLAGQTALVRQVLNGAMPPTRLQLPAEVETQLMTERNRAIEAAKSGKRRVLIVAHERAEIRAAIDLVEQFQLQASLVHPNELGPFIEDLKRLKIGVIAKPVTANDYDRYLEQVAEASAAGVEIAFGGESPEACRISASLASSLGMSRPAAIASLTDTAAKLAGANKSTGKLTAKQAANFVVWDGSPLDLCRKPINIVVAGQLQNNK